MVKKVSILLILFNVGLALRVYSINSSFDFYSVKISIDYDSTIFISNSSLNEQTLSLYKVNIGKSNYKILLKKLTYYKDSLRLNDWLFFKLIEKSVESIFSKESQYNKNLFIAFLLYKSNYDVLIGYYQNKLSVNVIPDIYPFDVQSITLNNNRYIDIIYLSDISKTNTSKVTYKSLIFNQENGQKFSLSLSGLKKVKIEKYIDKEISFLTLGEKQSIKIKINKAVIDIMKEYPTLDYNQYFDVDLSEKCYSSLITQLNRFVNGKTEKEKARLLLSFVRTSSKYCKDSIFYNNKSMIPEEALYYSYSDCEDRSALFYYLVKKIINVPIIVLQYSNHMNTAIKLTTYKGTLLYKGNFYSTCEPTDTTDTYDIGEDEDSNVRSYKVIKEYIPKK